MSQQLTSKDLAVRCQVSEVTVRRWRLAGTGPAYIKLGTGKTSGVRYLLEDVLAWQQSNRQERGQ